MDNVNSLLVQYKMMVLCGVIFNVKLVPCKVKFILQGGSNMTRTDFVFVTVIAHHSSNSQTGLNRF